MAHIPFFKMEGAGNDFVILNLLHGGGVQKPSRAWIRSVCDRRRGVGCDQLLRILPAKKPGARCKMEVFNPDGSEAEMCGNGIRAVALLVGKPRSAFKIETLSGLYQVEVLGPARVRVNMGVPRFGEGFEENGARLAGLAGVRFYEVNMGNPHAVIFEAKPARVDLEGLGRKIETHRRFPERTNVEFVGLRGRTALDVRVWERGAGATLACGTGACAAAVAAMEAGKVVSRSVDVHLPGGVLKIQWGGAGQPVWMTGPARRVFEGAL